MRIRLFLTTVLTAAAILQAAPCPAQDADSAKAFIASVYRHYEHEGIGIDAFSPHGNLYFHSSLIALMLEDQKAASPDVGAIDGDPVCACQEWDGIWDLKIDVHVDAPDRATAAVSFALSAPQDRPKDSLRKMVFTLAAENGEWRIYDILDETDPTAPFALRKALEQDIVSHSHH
jgi:hypothetical protein